jgi:hypothetical protein
MMPVASVPRTTRNFYIESQWLLWKSLSRTLPMHGNGAYVKTYHVFEAGGLE